MTIDGALGRRTPNPIPTGLDADTTAVEPVSANGDCRK
jgi:hypothetical protein